MKKALSAAEAKSITKPGSHYASGTLYLHVAPGGSKSWVQRITINGRRCDIGLGGFPVVSLAEARDQAYQKPEAGPGRRGSAGRETTYQDPDIQGGRGVDLRGEPGALAQ